jgi:hypothetical protein
MFFGSPRAGMHQVISSLAKEEPSITAMAVDPGTMDTVAFHRAWNACKETMPPAYVKVFEAVQKSKHFLNPDQSAAGFVDLVLNAPKSMSGHFISWNSMPNIVKNL